MSMALWLQDSVDAVLAAQRCAKTKCVSWDEEKTRRCDETPLVDAWAPAQILLSCLSSNS